MVFSIHSPPRFISCVQHDTLHHRKFAISPRISVEAYAHWHFRRSDDLTCYLTLTIYHGFVYSIYHHHSWLVFGMTPCTVNSAFHLALRIWHMHIGTPRESVPSLRLYMPKAFFSPFHWVMALYFCLFPSGIWHYRMNYIYSIYGYIRFDTGLR